MKLSEIQNSLSTIPGIGKATSALFAKLGIFTVGDLLQFYPRDFEDRTEKVSLRDFEKAPKVHTIAKVVAHEWFGYGRMKTLKVIINDTTATAELVCFNRPFMEKSLPVNSIISVTGKFSVSYGKIQSTSFEAQRLAFDGDINLFKDSPVPDSKIFPVYKLTEGLTQKTVSKAVAQALSQYGFGIEDEIPEAAIEKFSLMKKEDAVKKMHFPSNMGEAKLARKTLVFEELYNFQKVIALQSLKYKGKLPEVDFEKSAFRENEISVTAAETLVSDENFISNLSPRQKKLLEKLPYSLTPDQKKVILKINCEIDANYGFSENASQTASGDNASSSSRNTALRSLLQGDVGSGKTLVCFFASLRVIDYGGQTALMAPTEILARQHSENAAKLLSELDVNVAFLTGNLKSKGRSELLKNLKNGEIDFVIGTHALFSRTTEYKDLSLVIIDEQHRFGVLQRESVFDKGRSSRENDEAASKRETNLLMMSATPIPQSLALTFFGDLDVLTIKTMPQGRLPVKTHLVVEDCAQNAYEAVRKQLLAGKQAYFVYPAIESEGENPLKSCIQMFEYLSKQVYPQFKCALIHGKISEDEQNEVLDAFSKGEIQVLVATTVVEVGVDNPNATCIVIEMAERFGLSALHQLRGRVGRGKDQSYCFLVYSKNLTEIGKQRMKVLYETTDGFRIAKEDLRLRGPGEITGTAQSGDLGFSLADLSRDFDILMDARTFLFENYKTLSSEN